MSFTPLTPQTELYGRDGAPYKPSEDLVHAVNAALALDMPLLLTGPPGSGKTDLAFALARLWHANNSQDDWDPDDGTRQGLLAEYVRSDMQGLDLLYHYDALARFAALQVGNAHEKAKASDPRHFIELRALGAGLALSAQGRRRVVLIDEIDKAPRDLPNDLLRELDQGRFTLKEVADDGATVPDGKYKVPLSAEMPPKGQGKPPKPFVIITSNEERELPRAFLRRCVFHHLSFPNEEALTEILLAYERRRDRPAAVDPAQVKARKMQVLSAVTTFIALRNEERVSKVPSTAELLAWFRFLDTLPDGHAKVGAFAKQTVGGEDAWRLRSDPAPSVGWADVPGLGCLLKLSEDWRAVGAMAAPQRAVKAR